MLGKLNIPKLNIPKLNILKLNIPKLNIPKLNIGECLLISLYAWLPPERAVDPTDFELPKLPKSTFH